MKTLSWPLALLGAVVLGCENVKLPQGRQCSHWMTQPESIGLALDSYFFNAWESTVVYFFPQGYDARYWERFADATARAAKYEDFVLKGRRADDAVTATPSGAYAKNAKYPSAYLPKEKDVPMLQTVVWEKDGRRLYESCRKALEDAAREDAATEDANGPIDVDYMPVI